MRMCNGGIIRFWCRVFGMPVVLSMGMLNGLAATIEVSAQTGSDIQAAIDRLPPEGGVVVVRSRKGGIKVSKSIVINRNNVTLQGEGKGATLLKLTAGANVPVIVMGQTNAEPILIRRNNQIRNLAVDGNRSHQAFENDLHNEALRNNGITLRKVEECSVDQVLIRSCQSGGLVTEWGCKRLIISNIDSVSNQFDGIAGYQTEDSHFTHINLNHNRGAGFSFDSNFNGNNLSDCVITDNGDDGIFMRNASDNIFSQMQVKDNASHGVFMSHVGSLVSTAVTGNTFIGCIIGDNSGAGIRINNVSCVNNMVTGSQFFKNDNGDISESSPGLLTVTSSLIR